MTTQSDALAAAVQSLTEAMRATTSDPVDAIRILTALIAAPLTPQPTLAATAAQSATADLFRRAAVASIAMACADYQPPSSTDANAMIVRVGTLLDAEVTLAADRGELASYTALRDLRYAVIADLRARSANLPELTNIKIPGNLPSLVIAYLLYADTTREPGMVSRANVIHPGFMPPAFEALSS